MVNLDEIVGDHKVGKKYKDDIKVLSKQETWSVSEIKRRSDDNRIIIPKFQREDVWKETRKSRLIESVLRGIPIPPIYLAEENEDGKYVVIDGQQRIKAFVKYLNNSYSLKGLSIFKDIEYKKYNGLSPQEQRKINDAPIPVTIILKESDSDVRYEIFERLNTGGLHLNAQEIRNCIYHGNYNDLLKDLANDDDFKYLSGSSWEKWHERMVDAELVLRFFAFSRLLGVQIDNYKPPMKRFLNEEMEGHRTLSREEINDLSDKFKKVVKLTKIVFDDKAFKNFSIGTSENENGKWGQINKGLYDITLWGFAMYHNGYEKEIISHAHMIREELLQLITHDNEFIETITEGTQNYKKVTRRFDKWYKSLKNIIDLPVGKAMDLRDAIYKTDATCSICDNNIQNIDDAEIVGIDNYYLQQTLPSGIKLAHRFCNNNKRH